MKEEHFSTALSQAHELFDRAEALYDRYSVLKVRLAEITGVEVPPASGEAKAIAEHKAEIKALKEKLAVDGTYLPTLPSTPLATLPPKHPLAGMELSPTVKQMHGRVLKESQGNVAAQGTGTRVGNDGNCRPEDQEIWDFLAMEEAHLMPDINPARSGIMLRLSNASAEIGLEELKAEDSEIPENKKQEALQLVAYWKGKKDDLETLKASSVECTFVFNNTVLERAGEKINGKVDHIGGIVSDAAKKMRTFALQKESSRNLQGLIDVVMQNPTASPFIQYLGDRVAHWLALLDTIETLGTDFGRAAASMNSVVGDIGTDPSLGDTVALQSRDSNATNTTNATNSSEHGIPEWNPIPGMESGGVQRADQFDPHPAYADHLMARVDRKLYKQGMTAGALLNPGDAARRNAELFVEYAAQLDFMSLVVQHRLENVQLELRRVLRHAEEIRKMKLAIIQATEDAEEGKIGKDKSEALKLQLQQVVKSKQDEVAPEVQEAALAKLQREQSEQEDGDVEEMIQRISGYNRELQVLVTAPAQAESIDSEAVAISNLEKGYLDVIKAEVDMAPKTQLCVTVLTRLNIAGLEIPTVEVPIVYLHPNATANATNATNATEGGDVDIGRADGTSNGF